MILPPVCVGAIMMIAVSEGEPEPRKARASDLHDLVWLRGEMFAAMGRPDEEPEWRTNAFAWFQRRIDDPGYAIFVIDLDGKVVACAMSALRDAAPSPSAPRGGDVLISNVCTAPHYRGRGFGRAVFQAAFRWAQQTAAGRAELMATNNGRNIYESAGFTLTHNPAMRAPLTGNVPGS
jgi:GNAT superfamily N-acetyltransferase